MHTRARRAHLRAVRRLHLWAAAGHTPRTCACTSQNAACACVWTPRTARGPHAGLPSEARRPAEPCTCSNRMRSICTRGARAASTRMSALASPPSSVIYNVHSRRALDGHACGQCGVCTSGQPLGTRLAHAHAHAWHHNMLLARVCTDATHSEGSSLKVVWHATTPVPRRPVAPAPAARAWRQSASATREFSASRSIFSSARASAAHPAVTRSPRAVRFN
jgi:hypothetical protein